MSLDLSVINDVFYNRAYAFSLMRPENKRASNILGSPFSYLLFYESVHRYITIDISDEVFQNSYFYWSSRSAINDMKYASAMSSFLGMSRSGYMPSNSAIMVFLSAAPFPVANFLT